MRRLAPKALELSHRREYSGVADRSWLRRLACALIRSICPTQPQGRNWNLTQDWSTTYSGGDSTLFTHELHEPSLGSGKRYPYMKPDLARALAAAIARWDLTQCSEALVRLVPEKLGEVAALVRSHDAEIHRELAR